MRYYGSLSELRAVVSLPSTHSLRTGLLLAVATAAAPHSLSLAQADYVPVNSLTTSPKRFQVMDCSRRRVCGDTGRPGRGRVGHRQRHACRAPISQKHLGRSSTSSTSN